LERGQPLVEARSVGVREVGVGDGVAQLAQAAGDPRLPVLRAGAFDAVQDEERHRRILPVCAVFRPATVRRRAYDGKVGLSLLAGPANAGKVALLLERYLARLDDEPVLIVPNASDVDRVERDLLARCGCLFSGSIVTFDDLFRRLVKNERRPVVSD